MDIQERYREDDESMRRRYKIAQKLVSEWFGQCVPVLALEFGVPENEIKQDLASQAFDSMLMSCLRLPDHYHPGTLVGGILRAQLLSAIKNAAVSSDECPAEALIQTLQAIIEYLSAMRESVMISQRFQLESILVSRNRAPLTQICEECGALMRIIEHSGSPFAGCSNYPECYNTKQLTPEDIEAAPRVIDFWSEGDLERAIGNLMSGAVDWRPESYDEATTKADFIDPILRSLGWDTYENSNVQREYRTSAGRADYGLLTADGKLFAIIEAKKLYENLDRHQQQLMEYMIHAPAGLGILTNGFAWLFFEMDASGQMMQLHAIDDILNTPDDDGILKLCELIGRD